MKDAPSDSDSCVSQARATVGGADSPDSLRPGTGLLMWGRDSAPVEGALHTRLTRAVPAAPNASAERRHRYFPETRLRFPFEGGARWTQVCRWFSVEYSPESRREKGKACRAFTHTHTVRSRLRGNI